MQPPDSVSQDGIVHKKKAAPQGRVVFAGAETEQAHVAAGVAGIAVAPISLCAVFQQHQAVPPAKLTRGSMGMRAPNKCVASRATVLGVSPLFRLSGSGASVSGSRSTGTGTRPWARMISSMSGMVIADTRMWDPRGNRAAWR